tara:strand:- start:105 stop:431 length:327 start_codon:yes stop_codon:yes gene_type:complete
MSPRQLAALKRQMELAKRRRTGGGKTIRPGQRTPEQMARLKKVMGELGKTRSRPARPTQRMTAQQLARLAAQRRAAQARARNTRGRNLRRRISGGMGRRRIRRGTQGI